MLVLFIGIVLSGIVGLWTGSFDIWGWNASMGLGITNMGELIIVTLLAGGMLEMIRYNGGIDWIIRKLTSRIHSSKGAEMSIAALVSFANLCTANNTIALIMAGPIAKDIADRFKIDPPPQRQPIGYLLLLHTGNHPLRRPDVDGRRTRACLPYRDHAISLLPISIGSRRLIGDRIQLSEEIYTRIDCPSCPKKHNSIQSKKTIVSEIEYYCVR